METSSADQNNNPTESEIDYSKLGAKPKTTFRNVISKSRDDADGDYNFDSKDK